MPTSLSHMFELITQRASDWTTSGWLLRIALVACSLFTVVQLLTMFSTRYGESNATQKSFVLSLMLHCCLGLGWATAVQTYYSKADRTPGDPNEPFARVTVRGLGSDDAAPEPGTGDRPVWTQSVVRTERQVTRLDRPDDEPMPVELPYAEQAPRQVVANYEVTDFPSRPDEPVAPPTQMTVGEASNRAAALPLAAIDQPQTESRPEANSGSVTSRQPIQREGASIEPVTKLETPRGSSDRVTPITATNPAMSLPLDATPEVAGPQNVGQPADSIRRPIGASPAKVAVTDSAGEPTSTTNTASGTGAPGKFTRAGNRTTNDPEFDLNPPGTGRPSPTRSTTSEQAMVASRASVGGEFLNDGPKPDFVRPNTPSVSTRAATRSPETYRARRIEQRRAIALKNGGSINSERAVEASLRWMADVQESDGRWSSVRHGGGTAKKDPQGQDRLDGGLFADSGVTGLVVLSFLGAGYTHEEGQYSSSVRSALEWLIKQQQSNGDLAGKATRYDRMYCHAIATFALAEAYGMQSDPAVFPELRDSVRSAVRYIAGMQNTDGGWRYGRGDESDMSMFGWQLMALKSAVNAGITVPEETRRGMTKFLQARAMGTRGGLAGYKLNERPTPAMTAEALFCRQMFNVRQGDAASQEAVGYLRQNLPRLTAYDEYYWYYGTLAMFQYDGEPWEEWNLALRDMLISQQRTTGPLAGSWDPKGKWAGIGGRLYSTALATMSLEVYYRFLRIYQSDE